MVISFVKLFGTFVLVLLTLKVSDGLGTIFKKKGKPGRSSKVKPTVCSFGKKSFTIGHKWHPHLQPNGINYCITCRCKKKGLIHCARVNCKPVSCPGKTVPSGKCCSICPRPSRVPTNKKACHYGGKTYQQGEVWNVPMKNPNNGNNNCAECTCHNGQVSCAIRICPTLTCASLLQVPGKDSCCRQCRGLPLTPAGGSPIFKPAVNFKDSCFSKGRYYKDNDMWNPVLPISNIKLFQQPYCDLCSCQNTTVRCRPTSCPKLKCKRLIKKNPTDCCQSCQDKSLVVPVVNRTIPLKPATAKPKGVNYPHCKFLSKIYKHNTSWNPQIPGQDPNYCIRCTCEYSRIKCGKASCGKARICTGLKSCAQNQDPKLFPKPGSGKGRCSSVRSSDLVAVYLFVNDHSKRPKHGNYVVRIAIIDPKENFVKVHFWDVNNNRVTVKTSKPRKSRFRRRKANYSKIGETKNGRIKRFLNREKLLAKCRRNCQTRAAGLVKMLKHRVNNFRAHCRAKDAFRSLKLSKSQP